MQSGIVKTYKRERGFGFIETQAVEQDVFFHIDDVRGPEPRPGMELEFRIEDTPRGPRAEDIHVA